MSCRPPTVVNSALCLFNHLLCYQHESFKPLNQDLEQALQSMDEVLSDYAHSEIDLKTVLLCECRILYLNEDICDWVAESRKRFFTETHAELK